MKALCLWLISVIIGSVLLFLLAAAVMETQDHRHAPVRYVSPIPVPGTTFNTIEL
jgi:hypothetical protein